MKMSKQGWMITAACAAIILVGVGRWLWLRTEKPAGAAPPPVVAATEPGLLQLPKATLDANPLAFVRAAKVKLAADVEVVGSIAWDQDRYAIVGPLVAGRVARLRAGVGDTVRAGEVLAEIESAEVGQAQAAYLAAQARAHATQANVTRERELATQRISSEREREMAEAQAASDSAELQAARERLRAIGISDAEIAALGQKGGTGGRVPLRSPISGTVVARTVTLGQAVEHASDAFKVGDLSRLWILLDIYEKDLERVHVGQDVELRTESLPGRVFRARVAYVNPLVDEKTRTANVRIQLDNPKQELRPGQFVTAKLLGDPNHAPREVIAVAREAVQTVEGKRLVFVKKSGGFERRVVDIGASGGELVEIRKGLSDGEEVVSKGAFLFKSELVR